MFQDLWGSRELVLRLAHRDIAVRYRNSFLGYLWAVLVPVVTVALFSYLVSRRVVPVGETSIPYPAFALWNIVVWQLFANVLVGSTISLADAGSLVTRINFNKEVIVWVVYRKFKRS